MRQYAVNTEMYIIVKEKGKTEYMCSYAVVALYICSILLKSQIIVR